MSSAWHSPGSIFNIGHPAIKSLFTVPVQLQEKVDGSFFAFGMFPSEQLVGGEWVPDPEHLELKIRSKGAMMPVQAPQAMFKPVTNAVVKRLELLKPGWQYRGETLCKPKHNALAYERVPKDNIILFDICTDEETYLGYDELKAEADRLDFECVPQLYTGMVKDAEQFRNLLNTTSILGGQLIEGVVIKPLTPLYGLDKKLLMGKFVSEAFREVHKKAWGESNPKSGDILQRLGDMYASQARWQKALQRLREADKIINAPQDIGLLMQEVAPDIKKECSEEIKEYLFKWAWPHIARMAIRDLPEWYKNLLLIQQFEKEQFAEVPEGSNGDSK
jgi:hypothetical protein